MVGEAVRELTLARREVGTTAYGVAMLGCQVSAKLVEPFGTMERVSSGYEV